MNSNNDMKAKKTYLEPCVARSWTASQIRVEMSKSVSLDAATSSPRITCKKHIISDWERNSENSKVEKNTNQVWMRLKGALQGNM